MTGTIKKKKCWDEPSDESFRDLSLRRALVTSVTDVENLLDGKLPETHWTCLPLRTRRLLDVDTDEVGGMGAAILMNPDGGNLPNRHNPLKTNIQHPVLFKNITPLYGLPAGSYKESRP